MERNFPRFIWCEFLNLEHGQEQAGACKWNWTPSCKCTSVWEDACTFDEIAERDCAIAEDEIDPTRSISRGWIKRSLIEARALSGCFPRLNRFSDSFASWKLRRSGTAKSLGLVEYCCIPRHGPRSHYFKDTKVKYKWKGMETVSSSSDSQWMWRKAMIEFVYLRNWIRKAQYFEQHDTINW